MVVAKVCQEKRMRIAGKEFICKMQTDIMSISPLKQIQMRTRDGGR